MLIVAACGSPLAPVTPSVGASAPATAAAARTPSPTTSAPASLATAAPTSAAPSVVPTPLISPLVICTTQMASAGPPASPAPSGVVPGQAQADMGHTHVLVGTAVTYASCPPASGMHYNSSGLGPIQPRFYGPDDAVVPQNWVHNLEHGGLVILYNCTRGACDPSTIAQLEALAANFPASPRCNIPGGYLSPVIARFDTMQAATAALVWDRVLLQNALDVREILAFFATVGETTNPERYC
jgi:hypothetical protein